MNRTLIFAESVLLAEQLLTLAGTLGDPVHTVAIDESVAATLAACAQDEVILLQGASARPEDYARLLADLARELGTSLLLVSDTVSGRELAARTAAHLDAGLVSGAREVRRVPDGLETTRVMYAGGAVKKEALRGLAVVTVPAGVFPPATPSLEIPLPVRRNAVEADVRVRVLDNSPIERKTAGLDSSRIVVGVGLGFDRRDDLKLAEDLAASLHAAIGCTRPVAEDKRWLPSELYIGISGENIQPDLYIAVGISGQVQHLAGVRDAKTIVAINKEASAPIFKAADYGIVGDLYQVLPLLTQAIKGR